MCFWVCVSNGNSIPEDVCEALTKETIQDIYIDIFYISTLEYIEIFRLKIHFGP